MNTAKFLSTGVVALACGGGSSIAPLPAGGTHVLFVGNSLTYVNDLPGTVAAIAASAGDTFRVATAAGPDAALIDHLHGASDAIDQLKRGGWNVVVLQQGPTPAGPCRDTLVLSATMFLPLIQAAGAKAAFFMPWPGVSYPYLFDEVRVSFEAAAAATNGVFMPAGEAWRAAWAADSTLALYGGDGVHPSALGTFVAALEIYERLSGRDARTLPPQAFAGSRPLSLPVETVRRLQIAVHAADSEFGPHDAPTAEELGRPSKYVSTVPRC